MNPALCCVAFRKGLAKLLLNWLPALFSILLALEAPAQSTPNILKRYINRLINDTTSIAKPQFIAYPTLAFSPETSWEIGLSSIFVYYARRDTTNRLSEVNGFTFFTLNNQYGAFIDHALYTHRSDWSFLGRIRYQNFPLLYYGIGNKTPSEELATVDARQLNIRERVLKKVYRNVFAGPEVDYQRLSSVRFIGPNGPITQLPAGNAGSANLGLGGGVLYDDRHNVLNVREGVFAELALLRYNRSLGSDFNFTSLISDNRIYRSINKRDVLAAQLYGQFISGTPPFNQLSLLGGESLMRGYYSGRFRDRNQIAAQLEYRMLPLPFSKRWGAAVFGGTGTVFSQFSQLKASDLLFAGGAGVRFLLFPKKDIFTRLDLAFTREGSGIYIFIGEAF